ncbi:MAG TPA: hypothetical protein VLE02_05055 [Nitrosarchaeum sp.]|nr:hypothetical protein [Nitrosarchaeum sp.]
MTESSNGNIGSKIIVHKKIKCVFCDIPVFYRRLRKKSKNQDGLTKWWCIKCKNEWVGA